jgi:cytochrome b558/566 subunit A
MVRSFTTSDPQFQVQLTTGGTYYAAFAIWNGKLGESAHIKSVSQWYTLTISDESPPYLSTAPVGQALGISPTLAAVVGIGLLITGVIIGIVVRPKNKG